MHQDTKDSLDRLSFSRFALLIYASICASACRMCAGVTACFELPYVRAGNRTSGPPEGQPALLTAEPTLQPPKRPCGILKDGSHSSFLSGLGCCRELTFFFLDLPECLFAELG